MSDTTMHLLCRHGGQFVASNDGRNTYRGGSGRILVVSKDIIFSELIGKVAELWGVQHDITALSCILPEDFDSVRLDIIDDESIRFVFQIHASKPVINIFVSKRESNLPDVLVLRGNLNESSSSKHFIVDDPLLDKLNEAMPDGMNEPLATIKDDLIIPSVDQPTSFDKDLYSNQPYTSSEEDNCTETLLSYGQIFNDVYQFRKALREFAVKNNFVVKYADNSKKQVIGKCNVEGCNWAVYARRISEGGMFRVQSLSIEHTCTGRIGSTNHHPQATTAWVTDRVKARLCDNPNYTPGEMKKDILQEHGVTISYKKAWLARKTVLMDIHGSAITSYEASNPDEKPNSTLPLITCRRPGRPKKNKIDTEVREVRPLHCTRCGQSGHNRRTCTTTI